MKRGESGTKLLDAAEVAGIYGVSLRTVREWTATRELRHVRLGRLVRFRPFDVDAFVRSRVSPPKPRGRKTTR